MMDTTTEEVQKLSVKDLDPSDLKHFEQTVPVPSGAEDTKRIPDSECESIFMENKHNANHIGESSDNNIEHKENKINNINDDVENNTEISQLNFSEMSESSQNGLMNIAMTESMYISSENPIDDGVLIDFGSNEPEESFASGNGAPSLNPFLVDMEQPVPVPSHDTSRVIGSENNLIQDQYSNHSINHEDFSGQSLHFVEKPVEPTVNTNPFLEEFVQNPKQLDLMTKSQYEPDFENLNPFCDELSAPIVESNVCENRDTDIVMKTVSPHVDIEQSMPENYLVQTVAVGEKTQEIHIQNEPGEEFSGLILQAPPEKIDSDDGIDINVQSKSIKSHSEELRELYDPITPLADSEKHSKIDTKCTEETGDIQAAPATKLLTDVENFELDKQVPLYPEKIMNIENVVPSTLDVSHADREDLDILTDVQETKMEVTKTDSPEKVTFDMTGSYFGHASLLLGNNADDNNAVTNVNDNFAETNVDDKIAENIVDDKVMSQITVDPDLDNESHIDIGMNIQSESFTRSVPSPLVEDGGAVFELRSPQGLLEPEGHFAEMNGSVPLQEPPILIDSDTPQQVVPDETAMQPAGDLQNGGVSEPSTDVAHEKASAIPKPSSEIGQKEKKPVKQDINKKETKIPSPKRSATVPVKSQLASTSQISSTTISKSQIKQTTKTSFSKSETISSTSRSPSSSKKLSAPRPKSALIPQPEAASKKSTARHSYHEDDKGERTRRPRTAPAKNASTDSGVENEKTNKKSVNGPRQKYGIDAKNNSYKPGGGNVKVFDAKVSTKGPSSRTDAKSATPSPQEPRSPVKSLTTKPSSPVKTAQSRIGSLNNSTHSPGGGNVKIQSKKTDYSTVTSRVRSTSNIQHKAGGGNVKIESQKVNIETVRSKVGSFDNTHHKPGGGEKKITTQKVEWKVESRIGSLDNAQHSPGGGNVKIEEKKVDFKEKAQSKIGSKDNMKHKAGGGDKKIIDQKLNWKTDSRVGSLENTSHSPGGGNVKIEQQKLDFKEKAQSRVGSKGNIKHKAGGGDVKIESKKLDFKEKAESKIRSLDNVDHTPGGGDKMVETQKLTFKEKAKARTDSGVESERSRSESSVPEEDSISHSQ